MTETPLSDSEQAFLDRAVVIALGSNLPGTYDSSCKLLEAALKALDNHGLQVVRASFWWRSKAWPEGSGPDFLNGAAVVETELSATETLSALHTMEMEFGRRRGQANAPRTLDLDLIAYGRLTSTASNLLLPHPWADRRLFVMGPLAEIAPAWRHPLSYLSAVDLASASDIGVDAARIAKPSRLP